MKNIIWTIGFRPFFLAGPLVGILLVFYWAWAFFKGTLPGGYFDPIQWHAHEMIFGLTISIVAGFLLTASANWTGTKPASGFKLKLLFFSWLVGRLAMLLSIFDLPISNLFFVVLDMLFIPMLIGVLAPPLINSRQFRNIQFLFVLSLLSLGNLFTHLAAIGGIDFVYGRSAIYLGVNLILLIIVIIGGRVVPFFSTNAIPGLKPKIFPVIERLNIVVVCLFIFLDFVKNESVYTAWIALAAGFLNLIRLIGWKSWKTFSNPLLWILHLGYLWVVVGFILIFCSDFLALLPRSVAIHAFTAGAMGTFILGMMSRIVLGHSGRQLKLAKGFTSAYVFITLSVVIRIASGFFPEVYEAGILLAGLSWSLAFTIFLFYYFPILISPRIDGRAG